MAFKGGEVLGPIVLNSSGAAATTINTGTSSGTINIGNTNSGLVNIDCGTAGINVGVTANQHLVTIGNNVGDLSGGTGVRINAANGDMQFTITNGGHFFIQADDYIDLNTNTSVGINPAQTFQVAAGDFITLNSTGGTISIGNQNNAFDINLGTGAAQRIITIGNATNATSVVVNGGTGPMQFGANAIAHATTIGSVTGAAATTLQSGSGALNVTSTGGALTINSGTGALGISTDASATTVSFATGGAAKAVTLGSTNTTSATTVQSGSTGISITSATGNGPITVASGTGEIDIANSATNSTVKVGTGAGIKACTFGSATSTSATTLQSGSGALNVTATGGALTINSGTGNLSISNDASATTVAIATGGASKAVTLGSTNTTSSLALKYGTNDFSLASATGDVIVAIDTGEVTKPLQPAFLAWHSLAQDNVTGAGTAATYNYQTEIFDQNSDYDGTNTFTAPVTGKYLLTATARLTDYTTAETQTFFEINTSNRSLGVIYEKINPIRITSANYVQLSISSFGDMDVGDTAHVTATVSGMAGDTIDFGAASANIIFSGCLIC